MALQGNPFLGKLKIPAPDLSRIPETPFESKPSESAKPEAAIESNRLQTVSIGVNNRFQTVADIGFNRFQTEDVAPACNRLKPIETTPNRFQTVSETVSDIGFKLPPIGELSVLRYLADKEPSIGASIPVRRREIATATSQSLAGVKTALIRLTRTQTLELVEYKCGKVNGFTSYRLTEKARMILASKEAIHGLGFNRFQTVSETVSIGFPSSSSSYVLENFKTTTSDPEILGNTGVLLAPEWQTLDVSPLEETGFTQTHLIQIIRQGKLQPTEVQDSIHFFAYDLKRNGKGKELNGPPLNFFMGILRKGIPYAPPENFESPADEARRKTREFKERKERERIAEEQQISDLEFAEWRRGLSPDGLINLLPEYARKPGPIQDSALKAHFENEVWPVRQVISVGLPTLDRTVICKQIDEAIGKYEGND
jgi:hypothetical protein